MEKVMPRLNPHLLQVPRYVAGRADDEVREALGLTEVVKLASNECPIGPSPRAVEAARRQLAQAHRYPGVLERELRRKLAASLGHGLTEENILIAAGGTDALRLISQAFIFDGGNSVMSAVTFPMYAILTTAFGGQVRAVPPLPYAGGAFVSHDLAGMADAVDEETRLIFLCTPNNPTGEIIRQEEAGAFLAAVPEQVVVVFDESYCDYVTDAGAARSLELVAAGRNVLVVRSFSKSAGLANLRVGYVVGPPGLIYYLGRARLPFHVGDIALAAAAASLDDEVHRRLARQVVLEGRSLLQGALGRLGLCCLPSQGNFVTILAPPLGGEALAEALLQAWVIVRPLGGFGLPGSLRVSVGRAVDNERFIGALAEVLETAALPEWPVRAVEGER